MQFRRLILVFVSLALFLLGQTEIRADVLGLMDQPQTFPWSVGLAPANQEEAGGLAPGALRIRTSMLWFNTYRQFGLGKDMVQQVDMEGLLPMVTAAWSPGPGWELRGQVQGWILGGGLMDPFLSGFHGFLVLPNQGRDLEGQNGYRDYIAGLFDQTSSSAGITQLNLAVRGFSGPWSWSLWVKPPLPGPVDWGWVGSWSSGVGLGWGLPRLWADGGLVLGGGLSATVLLVQNDTHFSGSGGLTGQFGVYATLEVPWGFRGVLQGTWTKVPRTGDGYLDQGAGLLTSGFQVPVDRHWGFELALTEEFFTWATMEVGFYGGLIWTL